MRVLLDTHALLWWLEKDPRLSRRAHAAVIDGGNQVLVSLGSVWEVAIKAGLGQLSMPRDLAGFFRRHLALYGFDLLPITLEHVTAVRDLPRHHRDPFDRLLIAQSRLEGLSLVSADRRFAPYGVDLIW